MNDNKNSCKFIGRLGRDPEMKYTSTGNAITKFSIAVDMRKPAKDGEASNSDTTWVQITAWGKLAETASKILTKGTLVAVDTYMTNRKWEKDGVPQYSTDFTLRSMDVLVWGARNENEYESPAPFDSEDIPF